ncbi:neuroligin 4-like [Caerostris darwini]|uniref:Neuroligin 4-like n=1 Tax=Caerostris darwini TaxID=1538125 RepID=A0AAV4TGX3_9ARAC|nr:neuroligin 4-like [Caerostris darwini]
MDIASLSFKMIVFFLVIGICFSKGISGSITETQRISSRVVQTKYGSLRGIIATLSNRHLQPVEKFLGVPYAGVPTGSLRFMPPVTPPHWKGVRPADQLSPVCPQKLPDIANETEALKRMPAGRLDTLKRLMPFLTNQSEDCLYLNIYAPANSKYFTFGFVR